MSSDNVNVTGHSDLLTFLKYILYLFLLLGGLYILLHSLVRLTAPYLSYTTIDKLMSPFSRRQVTADPAGQYAAQLTQLETLKNRYFAENGFNGQDFTLVFVDTPQINAALFPNKQIVFTKGTLEEVSDERELFFILAHEIGHYKNKDAFKSLVEVLVSSLFISVFSNERAALDTARLMFLHYSRAQELEADCYAALKSQQVYGDTQGARQFFEYLDKAESFPQWKQYFATHPAHSQRLANLEKCLSGH